MQATEDQCELRSPDVHDEHCEKIADDPSKSREYGVNSNSVLNDLEYFHVCSGALVPDIMHDILEGALQYETKLILQKFIHQDKHFTLEEMNSTIERFDFGYAEEKNRPPHRLFQTLTMLSNKILWYVHVTTAILHGCSLASQMWTLGRYLPMMIGCEMSLDDEHWRCYCILLNIIQYVFAPRLEENDLAILQMVIQSHHENFIALYPDNSVIPKLHYMLHMPRLI